jgi:hypothetical protein
VQAGPYEGGAQRGRRVNVQVVCVSPGRELGGERLLAFAATIAADGRFYAPIGDATISAVDVRDIAAVAAAALTEPRP